MSRNTRSTGLSVCCFIALSLAFLQPPTLCYGFEIGIEVAPSTLNIQSQSQVVTVQTSIAYSSVAGASVSMNGIPISWWKADSQGLFVAKFVMTEVKALVVAGELKVPGENELTLAGTTIEGTEFTGTQTITVINVKSSGTK